MQEIKAENFLECTVLSGRREFNTTATDLYDRAFVLWQSTWQDLIFPNGFYSDSFFNAQNVLVLHEGLDVAAIAIYNFYDLQYPVYSYCKYVSNFRSLDILNSNDSFMTTEYICATPRWRKRMPGFGKVLIGLTQEAFKESDVRYSFGTPRMDIHVDDICSKYGFSQHGQIEICGIPCAVVVNTKNSVKVFPDPQMASLIKRLWDNRNLTQKLSANKTAA
ncbi:MAG: hypothetical protein K2Q26_13025 [Bdellovibrionales bacterium]|nr:hypothetical protein [Bdellovibrionales bacterium]